MPDQERLGIYALHGDSLHVVKSLDIKLPIFVPARGELPVGDRHYVPTASSIDQCSIAVVPPSASGQRHIHLFAVNPAEREIIVESTLTCPPGFAPKCIRFHEGRLFVAGGRATSQIGYFDIDAKRDRWNELELPFPHWDTRKEIDSLVSLGPGRLLAVDNIIYPKYLIDCDTSGEPVATRLIELPNHGTYERIERAACGKRWLAILSGTGSMGGPRTHLTTIALNRRLIIAWRLAKVKASIE